jgi:UDP-3-O-acyl-N-acetylglucosamine deacetylase
MGLPCRTFADTYTILDRIFLAVLLNAPDVLSPQMYELAKGYEKQTLAPARTFAIIGRESPLKFMSRFDLLKTASLENLSVLSYNQMLVRDLATRL